MDDRRRPEAGPTSHAATLSVIEAEIERAGALPRGVSGALAAVSRTLPAKERHDVASQLPQDLEQLWKSMPA